MKLESISQILVTGGTGSFGKRFISKILEKYHNVNRIVIYSRDEFKQWEMMKKFPPSKYPQLRFFLGDIRDKERLNIAFQNIELVIHAAALKQVPAAEYNPMEFVKTNVIGTENVIQAAIKNDVKKLITLSTDKAAAPINLYGATKLCADKLTIAANNIKGNKEIKFSVVRYGNVLGSRGSVIPFFLEKVKTGVLPVTHNEMTRFNITLNEGVDMVIWSINNTMGGEIFVPKIKSYRILDLVEAIGPSCRKKVIGIRPGEKIHEEMITLADSPNTIELNDYFAILPSDGLLLEKYKEANLPFSFTPKMFSYNSFNNSEFLSVEEIRKLIISNIDEQFSPK